jgi:hypothetical protein
MSKKQAEQLARQYVESQRSQFGKVKPEAVEKAVQRVAGALQALSSAK